MPEPTTFRDFEGERLIIASDPDGTHLIVLTASAHDDGKVGEYAVEQGSADAYAIARLLLGPKHLILPNLLVDR